MAETFDANTLQSLDRALEIDLETSRADGAPVHRVTIWIVVDGDAAYVRSVRGPAGRWHRELTANPRGAIHVDGQHLAIQAKPVEDAETRTRVTEALKHKYEQRWPGPLSGMLRDEVVPTTMRVEPA
jgi:hypothetical protein